jgi:hypothetical protein
MKMMMVALTERDCPTNSPKNGLTELLFDVVCLRQAEGQDEAKEGHTTSDGDPI